MPGSSTTGSCSSSTTVTRRSVVTDSNGNLWDMANPNIIGIESANSGTETTILFKPGAGGNQQTILVSFSTASAAFNAS
jgi:hypothetical protein